MCQVELTGYIENDLKNAAINFYRDVNKVYPLVQYSAGLKTVLTQLMTQSPSNSYQLEFYTSMYENYAESKEQFYEQLGAGHFIESIETYKLAPADTILTLSDKVLGHASSQLSGLGGRGERQDWQVDASQEVWLF